MKTDLVIARIRTARHEISEQFGHDPMKLVRYYMDKQKRHGERLLGVAQGEVSATGVCATPGTCTRGCDDG